MNRNTRTNQTRTFARLAAAIGAGVVTLGIAAPAFAETPEEPADVLDIVDAPECFDWTYDGLNWHYADNGDNSLMFRIAYLDDVNTCEAELTLKIYTLASPTAAKDDPGSSLSFYGGAKLSAVEAQTEIEGGLYNWAGSDQGECSQFDFAIDGMLVSTERVTDDCDELPIKLPEPQPEPENPDDITQPEPQPDPENPDDFTSNVPTDDPGDEPGNEGQGGELPSTGVASTAVTILAAALTGLGGLALFGARRRNVVA